ARVASDDGVRFELREHGVAASKFRRGIRAREVASKITDRLRRFMEHELFLAEADLTVARAESLGRKLDVLDRLTRAFLRWHAVRRWEVVRAILDPVRIDVCRPARAGNGGADDQRMRDDADRGARTNGRRSGIGFDPEAHHSTALPAKRGRWWERQRAVAYVLE